MNRMTLQARVLTASLSVLLLAAPWAFGFGEGRGMKGFSELFKINAEDPMPDANVVFVESNAPACIYYSGEKPEIVLQIQNRTNEPIKMKGKFDFYHWGSVGIPGDMWNPRAVLFDQYDPIPVEIDLAPNGWQNVTVKPDLPETMGGYGLVLDLGEHGRDFVVGLARAHQPPLERIQFPKQSLDGMDPEYLERLGVQAIRFGWSYVHSQEPSFEDHAKNLDERMKKMQKHKVTAVMEFGGGRYDRVFPNMRGWARTHLDDEGNQKGGKGDAVWMPKDDDDFEEFVYDIACKYGWPKGPITGFMLWNEPWEGISISGWGADMLRYRAIYERIGKAVERARKDAKVDVLIGGCDSSSNTWDKLLGEGIENSPFWPKYLDFCSIHYQGMSSPCLYKAWNDRKHYKGRVLIWDTESWVANTDDRIAGLIASNRAAGYDRSLGVFFGYLTTAMSHGRKHWAKVHKEDGTTDGKFPQPESAWPAAAAFLAAQKYIGERDFKEIVFKKGLPWVYAFDGLKGNPDDGTVVVVGDIGALFHPDIPLYRTVRSMAGNTPEMEKKREALRVAIREEKDRNARSALEAELKGLDYLKDCAMVIDAEGAPFSLYDFYGNRLPAKDGKIVIPLDVRGYFLRADPEQKGSFAKLVEAVKKAEIRGIEPVEMIPLDFLAPIENKPTLRIRMANMLNRPISGLLKIKMDGLTLEVPEKLELDAYEIKTVEAKVTAGQARSDNLYPLAITFDAGKDGVSTHEEEMHVNLIHKRTVTVDGNLEDWKGAVPQIIRTDEAASRTLTEEAWLPFMDLDEEEAGGFSAGYLAYDDDYFYFAAKVADATPHEGTLRYETMDPSEFFYPEVAYQTETDKFGMPIKRIELKWPEGVRRFSYRKSPRLPSTGQGEAFDNIQIAFNAIPFDKESDWITHLPGRMPKFTMYKCTDYEYALNTVAETYGGGTEVWRLQCPGMPRKHFYPRQPKSPKDGPVKEAKLATVYRGGARYTEVAIPWSELPDVKKRLDAGEAVKFTYRVNHDTGGPTMELARLRSVSRRNSPAMHPDWREHWANELEFAFEK